MIPRRPPNRHPRLLRGLRLHDRFAVGATATLHFGWLARELVCVKRMHPSQVDVDGSVKVEHPNVVETLGIARYPGEVRAAMEYVPGASLQEILEASPGGLSPRIATAIVSGALHGLHAAHERRGTVVPRGVSPSSILVGDDGRARLLDLDVHGPSTAAAIIDKLPYAAPEQIARCEVDARRDVWAAGVVLWEALAGRSLFHESTVSATLRSIIVKDVPAIDPMLDDVLARALARDPANRFATAREMAVALEQTPRASLDEVACALSEMDMRCINERRFMADAVMRRERTGLHIECSERASKE